uniref:Uncharacterized protein n=1 Tax=Ralstonia solanacearum TaxID=305 RepID=A0A0S4TTI3_RALSL|nr:protein of unknown function [Ralstonia solanacearum]
MEDAYRTAKNDDADPLSGLNTHGKQSDSHQRVRTHPIAGSRSPEGSTGPMPHTPLRIR